jgi:hypothetical protein
MKQILLFTLFVFYLQRFLHRNKVEVPPNGWTNSGNIQLLFNQSAFNKEWTGGGTSSISGNLVLNYEENYRWNNFSWTNRILPTMVLPR